MSERVAAPSLPQNIKSYLAHKNLENSRKRVYTKTHFSSESPWTVSHRDLGKYCCEILLHVCLAYTLLPLHSLVLTSPITQSCVRGTALLGEGMEQAPSRPPTPHTQLTASPQTEDMSGIKLTRMAFGFILAKRPRRYVETREQVSLAQHGSSYGLIMELVHALSVFLWRKARTSKYKEATVLYEHHYRCEIWMSGRNMSLQVFPQILKCIRLYFIFW